MLLSWREGAPSWHMNMISSVSGKFRAVWSVCRGRTESNGELLTWANILSESG